MGFKIKYLGYAAIGIFALIVAYLALKPEISINQSGQEEPSAAAQTNIASTGRVTMIDLGADACVPCKMMAPIIEELKKEYAGKADIIFIDVWKDPDQARKYGIQAIPTQIFFNGQGQETFRHMGFMDKQSIVDALAKLGVS